ncbi:MAG TPA: oxidoreductase, partial [Flavobacteriaceae bacterium]|nr:oxidoreductase [Flavobacteriaceae bacterium]
MKNILLIGGSYGIGLEIATQLQNDCAVYIASRTNEQIPENVTHLPFDVTKDAANTLELPDTIDGLVYCPGSINLKPFKTLSEEAFMDDLQINFVSLVNVVKALLPKLKNAEQASLVFFSTVAVQIGMPFHTSVAASKGAIEGF